MFAGAPRRQNVVGPDFRGFCMTRFDLSKAAIFVRAPEPSEPNQERGPFGPVAPQTGSSAAPHSDNSAFAQDVRRLQATLKHAFEEDPLDRPEVKPTKKTTDIGSQPAGAARSGLLSRV